MTSSNSNSRRNFLKKAGGITIGMAGISAVAGNLSPESQESVKSGKLFTSTITGTKDRITRVIPAADQPLPTPQ